MTEMTGSTNEGHHNFQSLTSPNRPVEGHSARVRFVILFVGDLHQPLDAADNGDHGGNEVRVSIGRRQINLHAVWDTALVQSLGANATGVANDLMARITTSDRGKWQAGGAASWANETWRVARVEIYAKLPGSGGTLAPVILPMSYASSEMATVSAQLGKAGVRLAWVLNAALR